MKHGIKSPREQYQTVLKMLEYAKMKGFEKIGKKMTIFRRLTWNGANLKSVQIFKPLSMITWM
jgi:hypothetical protein